MTRLMCQHKGAGVISVEVDAAAVSGIFSINTNKYTGNTIENKAISNIPNRQYCECTFVINTIILRESQTTCRISQKTLASAHSSKSVKIPADAKATISMATGYCSIRSKSNSWRLL